ncbi:6,7-dimethyl-8-ribityllumazine synthase [Raineya orbicola]|uniref:6,7-dimethyl-8-ribityllumazine synthase n=1 Tax=Raineya orbicola TaxID=2016530 RepID=A0A2N3IIY0_9BACT|nr:6,7-dimethyl-8-ribityllumazine synthase [Raineya orbicola]PKQ70256.1 lumazine-synth: 6,7-dimethyl-8-ribityllumazine synthase [Raineya orbicola]
MATHLKNLSEYSPVNVADVSHKRFGIVVAEWNSEVTEALLSGATKTLQNYGAKTENIVIKRVAGSFELPLASQWLAQRADIDAVIAIGCIIQGETRHFDFIAQAVAEGIMQVGLKHNKPVIFGVLTTNNLEQALERAGGKHGNKGEEAAITAIKMIHF